MSEPHLKSDKRKLPNKFRINSEGLGPSVVKITLNNDQ